MAQGMGWPVALRRREEPLLLVAAGTVLAALAFLPLAFLGGELAKGEALRHAVGLLARAGDVRPQTRPVGLPLARPAARRECIVVCQGRLPARDHGPVMSRDAMTLIRTQISGWSAGAGTAFVRGSSPSS
jgi:hypothetical protein